MKLLAVIESFLTERRVSAKCLRRMLLHTVLLVNKSIRSNLDLRKDKHSDYDRYDFDVLVEPVEIVMIVI